MNTFIIAGIILLVAGIAIITASQILVHRMIKNYSKKITGEADKNEMS